VLAACHRRGHSRHPWGTAQHSTAQHSRSPREHPFQVFCPTYTAAITHKHPMRCSALPRAMRGLPSGRGWEGERGQGGGVGWGGREVSLGGSRWRERSGERRKGQREGSPFVAEMPPPSPPPAAPRAAPFLARSRPHAARCCWPQMCSGSGSPRPPWRSAWGRPGNPAASLQARPGQAGPSKGESGSGLAGLKGKGSTGQPGGAMTRWPALPTPIYCFPSPLRTVSATDEYCRNPGAFAAILFQLRTHSRRLQEAARHAS
jgi:hypothetical protein